MEHVKQTIEQIGHGLSIPKFLPDNGLHSAPARRQTSSPHRVDGCICDGSGWSEERREFTRQMYELDGVELVAAKTVTDEKIVMIQCPACYAHRLQAALAAQSGLLESELRITLEQVVANGPDTDIMLEMAREFCREPWGVWTLWGTFGNAKTMILQAVVNHFRRQRHRAVYVRFKDLLDYIRAGNAPDARDDDRNRYHRLRSVQVLAIDECDKARLTEYAQEFRSAFLDDRWRFGIEAGPEQRHTLLAMNDDPSTLPGHIYDRLRDGRFGCWLDNVWFPGITQNRDESMRHAMERRR